MSARADRTGAPARRRATGAALLAVGLVTGLGGCGVVPLEKSTADVSKVAAEEPTVQRTYDNYEKARGAAFAALDPEVLALVETGPVLAVDAGAIDVAKRLHGNASTGRQTTPAQIEDVYTPRLDAYPLWFVATARDEARGVRRVQVFERASSTERWELTASPEALLSTVLPVPRTKDGALETVDPDQADGLVIAPGQALAAYAATLGDPNSPRATDVAADSFITQMRAQAAGLAQPGTTFRRSWSAQQVRHTMRTEDGGALVFGTLMRQDGWVLAPGATVRWPEGSEQRAYFGDPMARSGVLRYYHQVLMYVPPLGGVGQPRVLGQYGGVIGSEDTGPVAAP
ncbi:hypothetical protein [Mumia zhuanghuii]|uniref:DUF8094 domain-containing protein n=1 Tax=Mumia zhuanghuii TaxID=2585211 RepID=A0A5C4MB67_9ACTN|nr:hypothetical protein [Mumia zhuanghuii]TNC33693.1 hypothetical protein FHE65_28515 [Mumia zhuanghuii]TNC33929.1 hypothetical protein FHE65_28325 [Mumia zhuanghuii]